MSNKKLPKDWEIFIKTVEKILKIHAREIAIETVKTLYFGKMYSFKRKKKKK